MPLALEYATLFCTENNIHDKRCPPQIVNKLIIDNHIKYNEKQIKKILKNNYFTLEKKIEIHKLNENVNTQYDNYKLLSYMNGNKCFSMTDTNNAEIIQSEETNIINTISKLTPAQIEFNELFGLSAFQQLDVTYTILIMVHYLQILEIIQKVFITYPSQQIESFFQLHWRWQSRRLDHLILQ